MKQLKFLTLIGLLLFSGCEKDRLSGNGNLQTETRVLTDFNSIRASGISRIQVSYGNEFKVVLKGSGNLLPYFKTRVIDRDLILGYENASVRHDDVEVFLTLPRLKSASLSGSGDLNISGNFQTIEKLDLSLSGSGEVRIADEINIDRLEVSISGSGAALLQNAICRDAEIHISGSGDARVRVLNFLKARISGSGKIYYKGNPQVDLEISGSGRVIEF